MYLKKIINNIVNTYSKDGVPLWMMGYYKRKTISYFNGLSDNKTDVCWFQSKSFTIDLRLPISRLEKKEPLTYNKLELEELANYEGWIAKSIWDKEKLYWTKGTSYHNYNKWPEAAYLKKIGNCMMEFCPSNVYVEDWRLQNNIDGVFLGLELIEEKNLQTQEIIKKDGGIIICGEFAAICIGRENSIQKEFEKSISSLFDILTSKKLSQENKLKYLDFETSVARGNIEDGYKVYLSTNPNKYGENIFDLDKFEYHNDYLFYKYIKDNIEYERRFKIDFAKENFAFENSTKTTIESEKWFEFEKKTLGRYLERLV